RKGLVANRKATSKNLQGEAFVFIGMSHLEIECTRLHRTYHITYLMELMLLMSLWTSLCFSPMPADEKFL
ncbi:hypothetical protein, partial [Sinorhizobium meliloti]|uniref:hypothetical protein n=1 Tax=Rhizobium meliloti TaxID=382 RepID=UPI001AECA80B